MKLSLTDVSLVLLLVGLSHSWLLVAVLLERLRPNPGLAQGRPVAAAAARAMLDRQRERGGGNEEGAAGESGASVAAAAVVVVGRSVTCVRHFLLEDGWGGSSRLPAEGVRFS